MHDPNHSPLKDLERAPLLAPPEALWPRLRDRQRRAVARRRMLAGAVPLAAAAALAIGLLAPRPAPEIVPASAALDAAEVRERIVTLDRALQAAYESDASDEDVAPMWIARAQLLDRLPATAIN